MSEPGCCASVSGSGTPAKRALSSAEHNAFCVYRHVLLTKQLVPITEFSGLGEKDSPVCWLAVGDARCFSLDRSAAASILCNLSVFVSG